MNNTQLVVLFKDGTIEYGNKSDIIRKECFDLTDANRVFMMTDAEVQAFYIAKKRDGEEFYAEDWLEDLCEEAPCEVSVDTNNGKLYYELNRDENDISEAIFDNRDFYQDRYIHMGDDTDLQENTYYELNNDYDNENDNCPVGIAMVPVGTEVFVEHLRDGSHRLELGKVDVDWEVLCVWEDEGLVYKLTQEQCDEFQKCKEQAEKNGEEIDASEWLENNATEVEYNVPLNLDDYGCYSEDGNDIVQHIDAMISYKGKFYSENDMEILFDEDNEEKTHKDIIGFNSLTICE